jgi:hypothetical protein
MSAVKPLPEAHGPGYLPPIAYMERTRAYYLALGYPEPYVWAQHAEVPFVPLRRPLAESTIAIVTTAAPFKPEAGPQGPGAPYNAAAKFYKPYSGSTAVDHDLRIAHVAIDRAHTTMADSNTWFPLPALRRLAEAGQLRLAPRFFGLPTNRSQRHSREVDCPALLRQCLDDGVDAVLLVANCPVCHQSLALAVRHLEAHGIATVLLGCARDVVEHCGVPRFLFSDFPLGNAAGRPHDPISQRLTLQLALDLLTSAPGPRTTWQSPLRWADDDAWKLDYANPDRLDDEELQRLRAEAEAARQHAKKLRDESLGQLH